MWKVPRCRCWECGHWTDYWFDFEVVKGELVATSGLCKECVDKYHLFTYNDRQERRRFNQMMDGVIPLAGWEGFGSTVNRIINNRRRQGKPVKFTTFGGKKVQF